MPTIRTVGMIGAAMLASAIAVPLAVAQTATAVGEAEVQWKVTESWETGYQGSVIIVNRSSQAIEPWQVDIVTADKISSVWDATKTDNTNGFRVTAPAWAPSLGADSATSFGFIAGKSAATALVPTSCTIKGMTCRVVASTTPNPAPSVPAAPSPAPSTAPIPAPLPGGSPTGGLSVVVRNSSDWGTGRTIETTVVNNRATPTTSWSVSLAWPSAVQMWNATPTFENATLTASSLAWNAQLAPGAATSYGFNDRSPEMPVPGSCAATIDGVPAPCSVTVPGYAAPEPTPEATQTPTPEVTQTPTPEATQTPTPEATQTPDTPAPPPGKKTVAYYTAWATYARNHQVSQIPAKQLTHINYAFANIANGQCALGDSYADTDKFFPGDSWDADAKRGNFNQLAKLKAANPGLRTLISVGGWSWSAPMGAAAATPQSRATFAQSCVSFMKTHGFDGIDIDWEYPVSGGLTPGTAADKANYTLLLQALRDEMNRQGTADGDKHYDLTIAAPAGPSTLANLEIAKISAIVDWINMMTYDYHGGWEAVTGHNAPLAKPNGDPGPAGFDINSTVNAYKSAGAPSNKLVLGVPFYGHSFAGVGPTNNGLFQATSGAGTGTWEPGSVDYKDIAANYLPRLTRHYDASAKVPYLYDAAKREFITYDDPASMTLKANYIAAKGLGGGMLWELSSDTSDSALLNALNKGMATR